MKLHNPGAQIFRPDGGPVEEGLQRTSHLAIGAHPDDVPIIALHGILDCLARPDRWFGAVVVTDGAGSPRSGPYADHTDQQMRAIRIDEEKKAAVVGEYSFVAFLDHSSRSAQDPDNRDVAADLVELIAAAGPRVVYTHALADRHDTHVATALRTIEAIQRLAISHRPRLLYGCEVWGDLDWLVDADKVVLDVSAHPNLATSILGVYDSQISGGKRYDLAVAGRRLAHATFSESHQVDTASALTYAMDLTPLIADDRLDPRAHVERHVQRMADEIGNRISRLSP